MKVNSRMKTKEDLLIEQAVSSLQQPRGSGFTLKVVDQEGNVLFEDPVEVFQAKALGQIADTLAQLVNVLTSIAQAYFEPTAPIDETPPDVNDVLNPVSEA